VEGSECDWPFSCAQRGWMAEGRIAPCVPGQDCLSEYPDRSKTSLTPALKLLRTLLGALPSTERWTVLLALSWAHFEKAGLTATQHYALPVTFLVAWGTG
jgi:hypothetical protein